MSPTTVLVVNGPNLGRLGRREPEVYGSTTHDELVALIEREAGELGLKAVVRQSDSEAELLAGSTRPPTRATRSYSTPERSPTRRSHCATPVQSCGHR